MRTALGAILGLALLPWVMAQEADSRTELPSAESILDRYVEVTGGAAAYKSRTSEVTTGTFEISAAGLVGQLRTFAKPGLQRTSVELPGVGLMEGGVKDGVAWRSNPFTGPQILEGLEAEIVSLSARPGAAAHWREQYSAVKTVGLEAVNGEPAYRVVHTLGAGSSLTGFYGVDSGLMLKLVIPGEAPLEQFIEEYSDFEGIRTPSRVVIMQAGQRIVSSVTSVEANVEIPDERFALPEGVQALLK